MKGDRVYNLGLVLILAGSILFTGTRSYAPIFLGAIFIISGFICAFSVLLKGNSG